MKTPFFNHPRVRQVVTVLLLFGALTCIFPPATTAFQWWAGQSFIVAICYVALGLVFLVGNNTRLMFVCLGCATAISFHCHEKQEHPLRPKMSALPAAGQEVSIRLPPTGSDLLPCVFPHEPASPCR